MPRVRADDYDAKTQNIIAAAASLFAKVGYDNLQGTRFRHATHFKRWRPDREPASCTYAQLEVIPPHELATIFSAGA